MFKLPKNRLLDYNKPSLNKRKQSKNMEHLEQFRQEVRDWLEENCPPSMRTPLVPEEEVWAGEMQNM